MLKNIKQLILDNVCYLVAILGGILFCSLMIILTIKNQEVDWTRQEFKLLSAYVETRNDTNMYGGILRTGKYVCFCYATNSGKVITDEKPIPNDYVEFELGSENKLIEFSRPGSSTYLVFIMTEEMYNQVFTSK